MDPTKESIPLFYLRTADKISRRKLYVNFKCTSEVQAPSTSIEETKIINAICDPMSSPEIENFKIPLVLGKIYWSKLTPTDERYYVTTVQMNDRFAYRKVIPSEVIRHYVISVVLSAIEDKFNDPNAKKLYGQWLGHRLDLDQAEYEVLGCGDNKTNCVEESDEIVENKVMFVECQQQGDNILATPKGDVGTIAREDTTDNTQLLPYDLYYRPKSQILTIQLSADQLPERIELNDDHVCIIGRECAGGGSTRQQSAADQSTKVETKLMDVYLPFYIDLSVPIKYKYDDKLCLFRAVFKILEEKPASNQ